MSAQRKERNSLISYGLDKMSGMDQMMAGMKRQWGAL